MSKDAKEVKTADMSSRLSCNDDRFYIAADEDGKAVLKAYF
jgi:hypothetical protein